MHPFLCRASIPITRHPVSHYCCCFCFSSASVAINYNQNYNYKYAYWLSDARNTKCSLKLKFGEFYKRFYSAMSGEVVVVGDDGTPEKTENINGSAEDAEITRTLARRNRRRRLAEIMSREGTAGAFGAPAADACFLSRKFSERQRRPPPGTKWRLHPSQRFVPKERRLFIEKSTMQLTSRFLEHNRLCRELRAQIKRRQRESSRPGSKVEAETLEKSLSEETELLKRTLRYITTHYYESPTDDPAQLTSDPSQPTTDSSQPTTDSSQPTTDSSQHTTDTSTGQSPPATSSLKTTPIPWFVPYLPPFPNYTSGSNATSLNRALVKLLLVRPPPPALVPKLCYNLLTSPSPPNVHTYNILIEGLTRVRHGFLAHVVFRNMVDGGLGPQGKPDEGTIIRMLNLCVKTADRDGFDRIVKITTHRNMATWWGFGSTRTQKSRSQKRRGKMVLEAMIHGAARFGDIQQVRVWIRAMRRECPGSPHPGLFLLTSLIRMWTERVEWDRGLRCWRDLMRLDLEWHRKRIGEPADLRAFCQMLKLCGQCEKTKMYNRVLGVGMRRGWTEKELTRPVSKTKGLRVRRENKTPHIRAQRGTSEEDTGVLIALRRLWAAQNRAWEKIDRNQNKKREEEMQKKGDTMADNRGDAEKKRPGTVSDEAKSKIWDNIISRRMDDVRPASVSGGEVRQELARKRQQARTGQGGYGGHNQGMVDGTTINRVYS